MKSAAHIRKYLLSSLTARILLLAVLGTACHRPDPGPSLILRGHLTSDTPGRQDLRNGFVEVAVADDLAEMMSNLANLVVSLQAVDPVTGAWEIDLRNTGLTAGDKIFVYGFFDDDYDQGLPNPTIGDFIGLHIKDDQSVVHTLKSGVNEGLDINASRQIYDLDVTLSGTLTGAYRGAVVMFAYAGSLDGLDRDSFRYDNIVGVSMMTKSTRDTNYEMRILPYGFAPPIHPVHLFAHLDENDNGKVDPGEKISYLTGPQATVPASLTIGENLPLSGLNLDLDISFGIPNPNKEPLFIEGQLIPPAGVSGPGDLIVMVSAAADPNRILENPAAYVKAFRKVEGTGSGSVPFRLDLTSSEIRPGDEVMISALWDQGSGGGIPTLSEGDFFGYYLEPETFGQTWLVKPDQNQIGTIRINRRYYEQEASVQFSIDTSRLSRVSLQAGDQILVSLVQQDGLDPADFRSFSTDHVLGFNTIVLQDSGAGPYEVKVVPFQMPSLVQNPFNLPGVYVLGILDRNRNGRPDQGEPIGYVGSGSPVRPGPVPIDLQSGPNTPANTLKFGILTY